MRERIVLRFNDFTGRLEDAYWLRTWPSGERRADEPMSAAVALAYLASNPETPCEPLKV